MKKRKKEKGAIVSRLPRAKSESEVERMQQVERMQEETRKKRANRVIKSFMRDFPGRSLLQLLPVIQRRCSDPSVVKVAVARIERNQAKELSYEDRLFLEEFKREINKETKAGLESGSG